VLAVEEIRHALIGGDWAARAQAILTADVYPAIQRQAEALKAVRPGATRWLTV